MPRDYVFFPYLDASVVRRFAADIPAVRRRSALIRLERLMPSTELILAKAVRPIANSPDAELRLIDLAEPNAFLPLFDVIFGMGAF